MKHFFKIASFSLALCAFLGTASLKEWAFLNAGAPTAEAVEAPLLNFQIVSDIHYNINGYNTGYAEPRPKFLSALDFNAEHFPGSDALVVAGDFTVAGTEDQYSQFSATCLRAIRRTPLSSLWEITNTNSAWAEG